MKKKNCVKASVIFILLATIMMALVASEYVIPVYAPPPPLPNPGDYIVADWGAPVLWWVPFPAGPPAIIWAGQPLGLLSGVAIDAAGNYIVTDMSNATLWMIPRLGGPPVPIWAGPPFVTLRDVAIDAVGNYIVADLGAPALWIVPVAGGAPAPIWNGAPFAGPTGVAIDAAGNYIVTDFGGPGGSTLWMVPIAGGPPAPIWSGPPLGAASGVAIDVAGNYIVTDLAGATLWRVPPAPPAIIWAGNPLVSPEGVTLDAAGNYIVVDDGVVALAIVPPPAGPPAPIFVGPPFVKPKDVAIVFTCVASFIPTSGTAPLAVQFTATPLGGIPPFTFQWNFGDGGSSTSQNPIHTYQNPGNYNWTVNAFDGVGRQASAGGTVTARPPTLADLANFTTLPTGNMTMVIGDLALNPHGSKPSGVFYQQGRDTTPLGYLRGMVNNTQPCMFDTNSSVNANGRPGGAWPLIFTIGGPDINGVTHYYEHTNVTADRAPVTWSEEGSNVIWRVQNGTVVVNVTQASTNVPPGTSDVFAIQILRDADGRLVVLMYGERYTGTWAAAEYFKFIVYPNIVTYTDSYYIVRWTDAASGTSANMMPDSGDTFQVIAQGIP
jgi:hypothetical protein